MRTLSLVALVALAGCDLPLQKTYTIDSRWDPSDATVLSDGLYFRLLQTPGMVRLSSNGTVTPVDFSGGFVDEVLPSPDGSSAVALVRNRTCEGSEEELKGIETMEDCPRDLVVETQRWSVLKDGAVVRDLHTSPELNALAWSEKGTRAIAFLDFDQLDDHPGLGVLNLTSVEVVNLETGIATPISVGFAAERILFAPAREGEADSQSAVVLSQNSVALIDLSGETPVRTVTFPLTLDADTRVTPVGVDLTPNGEFALISAQGVRDLYVLDLVTHSVNMVSLSGAPTAMAVDADADRTALVFSGAASVDILEHDYFELSSYALDEPMSSILQGDGFALLYNPGNTNFHDIYRLDYLTGDTLEYRAQNPVTSLHLSPNEDIAIALTRAEYGWSSGVEGYYDRSNGMEILDLRDTERARSYPYILEAYPVGMAFSETEGELHAIVLQQGLNYLYQLNLYTGAALEVDLSAAPVEMGSMADGTLYISHRHPGGHVTFYNPVTQATTEVYNFAMSDLFAEYPLAATEVE